MVNNQTDFDQDFYKETDGDNSACSPSPTQTINVRSNFWYKYQREYLERLRHLILSEEEESKSLKFNFIDTSVSKIISKYPPLNPFKQITTKEIQGEILMSLNLKFVPLRQISLRSR